MFSNCPYCLIPNRLSEKAPNIKPHGGFRRKCDGVFIARYRCYSCGKTFSESTNSLCFRQRTRHLNHYIFKMFSSGGSQRRISRIFNLNRKTIVRKFGFLSSNARNLFHALNEVAPIANEVQFDDLETHEHSKLKPVSVLLAVDKSTRRILDFGVAQMPANGKTAKFSRLKYGARVDHRSRVRREVFRRLKQKVQQNAVFESDQNPYYGKDLKESFPFAKHITYKGRRGRWSGFGELKVGGFDPLFSLNHTCAMLRYGVSRLIRKTWVTTKKIENLEKHLYIYCVYHNRDLIGEFKLLQRVQSLLPIFYPR